MEILAKRALVIVVVLYLVLISCPGLAHAQLSSTTVTITHPAVGSSVPPTVIFSCTSAALGATVNYYIADVCVTGGRSAFSHSLRTTAASVPLEVKHRAHLHTVVAQVRRTGARASLSFKCSSFPKRYLSAEQSANSRAPP